MITIDREKCIGCGACAKDCFLNAIEINDGKAEHNGKGCMSCGHCIAVCPQMAVTLLKHDMSEVIQYESEKMDIDPQVYLNHLKFRRSIRKFTDEPVSKEQLDMILEAGRFSPTGGNMQNVAYFVSQKGTAELKGMIIDSLKAVADEVHARGEKVGFYSDMWVEMYKDYHEEGKDRLFFDAPAVIVVSSPSTNAAMIAAAHMETMVYSLGLGMLYSGFSITGIDASPELQEYLQLREGYKAQAVLIIGHPAVKYCNTVPRKPLKVTWN